MSETAKLTVRVFGGDRILLANASDLFIRIIDGTQKQHFAGTVQQAITGFDVPFFDNDGDNYAVLVSKPGYVGSGFHPVTVSQAHTEPIDLMLFPEKHRFDFSRSTWAALQVSQPSYCQILSAIAPDAQALWDGLLSGDGAPLAADMLNILTAMQTLVLIDGSTPLNYLRAVNWDGDLKPQQDRFYVWIDDGLVNEVKRAAAKGQFDQEFNPKFFHKGATLSYKENRLADANVQLTFHENTLCPNTGFSKCILLEPDIDFFPDLASHGLLEVIPGLFSLTDPRTVYVMRWIASRRAVGVPEFNPLYSIQAV